MAREAGHERRCVGVDGGRARARARPVARVRVPQVNTTKFYEVLGVPKDATTDQIKKAFRNLAKTVRRGARGRGRAATRVRTTRAPPPRRNTPTRAGTRTSSRKFRARMRS